MERIIRAGVIWLCVMFAIQAAQLEVNAMTPTQPVGSDSLSLYFSIPSNDNTTLDPKFTDNNCIGYTGQSLVQSCRVKDTQITDPPTVFNYFKNGVVTGGNFPLINEDQAFDSPITFNNLTGELGVFFYQGPSQQIGNYLFVGQDGNDLVTFLYQAPLSYSDGAEEGIEVLRTFTTSQAVSS